MLDVIPNFIDGERHVSAFTSTVINPSDTSDIITRYSHADANTTIQAVEAARRAFVDWAKTSCQLRHDILVSAAHEIMSRRDSLGELLSREEGKTLAEGVGEVVRAAQVLSYMAGEALRINGDYIPGLNSNVHAEIIRVPVGVISVITPWNFPVAIPAWKIGAALAFGNTVVFKPSEYTPCMAWELTDILHRAGLPGGVLNLVMGRGHELGPVLAGHVEVDGVSFTGSVPTGRTIAAMCVESKRMKRMQLEMGGKNPLVVLDDANLDLAVECALNGAFYSAGQRCTASSRLIVQKGIHNNFVNKLTERLENLRIGHALDPNSDIGPLVNKQQYENCLSYIEIGKSEGATLHSGGYSLSLPTNGYFIQPALFTNTNNNMRICREEIFGPVATVTCVDDYESALQVANDTDFGLSSAICTSSLKYAEHFKHNSEAGIVKVNQGTSGLDYHLPFGGCKNSSYGPREQGAYARDMFTITKTAYTQVN